MSNLERTFFVASGIAGCLAVVLGAFGAHALGDFLSAQPDGEARRKVWETAAHYHLAHSAALAVAGYLASKPNASTWVAISGWAFVAGILLFSGSLYAMALTGARALGAITPFGGLSFIVGWASIAVAAWRL